MRRARVPAIVASPVSFAGMDRTVTARTKTETVQQSAESAQRIFTMSMVVSGVRCVLSYVILPFITPFLGLAPGVGPILGIAIGTVAIAANVWSLNRFWRLKHRWRKPITVLHVGVIALVLVLIAMDVAELAA
jgi:hypothetical protein